MSFNIIENKNFGEVITEAGNHPSLAERLKSLTTSSDIVVFMKGTSEAPQCGFSANTCAILNSYKKSFKTFNILADQDVRQGLKEFSNWPTYPQIYYKGKLLGGNDVIMEMHDNGELKELLG
ncbi:MAG: Grx4 family monothiol glutaredoxin [Bacteriovoracaceae bacterium]